MDFINIQHFPKLCRICLNFGNIQNMFERKVVNVYKLITSIEISENDVLPKNVCGRCLIQLEEVSSFVDKCITNNSILNRVYLNQKENESDEVEDENGFDNDIYTDQNESIPKSVLTNKEPTILPATVNNTNKRNTTYECPECSKGFAFAENLRKHALTHKGVKPFICKLCGKGFLRKRSLDEHTNFHTGKTPYVCAYCGEAFKRLTDHAAHIYRLHNTNIEGIPKHKRKYTEKRVHLKIECKLCRKVFASRSGFANHQLIHKGVKKFLCNICGKNFITNPSLQNHMRIHTGEKPFQCKQCGRCFRQRSSLNTHMSQHNTVKSLSCPTCGKKYYTRNGLSNHLQTHSEERSCLDCPQCNKRFHSKQVLHSHLLKHGKEKKHGCNLCHKSFTSPSQLNVHLRTHSGEKPFSCVVCGKQLAQPQTLKVHMRQHTGETPYVCSVCDKGYRDSSNLKRHFNRHHGDNRNACKSVIVNNNEGSIEADSIKS